MRVVFPEEAGRGSLWRAEQESAREFRLARRRSIAARFGRRLRRWFSGVELCCEGCCEHLLCLDGERGEVEHASKARTPRKRSLETVELERIVGSVGRCRAFDTRFLPACSCSMERWKRVERAVREGKSLPPVELYRLGRDYYVLDGNHRVSVAKHHELPAIEALVTDLGV